MVSAYAMADGAVVIGVGHSWTKSFGKTPFESKPTISVDNPGVASISWQGGESGSLVITGVEEGEAVVTVKGKVRVTSLGTGGGALTVKDVSGKIWVKVIKAAEYSKIAVLWVKQKMSIKFPKGMKLGSKSPNNSNPAVVSVRRNSSKQITLVGRKKGRSTLTFKLLIKKKDGKVKEVPGTIWVKVKDGKPPKKEKFVRIGWDDLFIGEIVLVDAGPGLDLAPDDEDSGTAVALVDWPGIEGVGCTFTPSGKNYGDIGDLAIENDTDKPVTVTIPPGLLLDSADPAVQDLYVADVPTETPYAGAKDIDRPITIKPGGTYVAKDLPGFCPDFEKKPPQTGDTEIYACQQPDEKSKVLLDTIEAVKKLDVGSLKLQVFEDDKTRAMVAQGSLWMVDSRIDEVKDNEVSADDLSSRFYETFVTSAKEALDKMSPDDRKKAEQLVKDDIKTIVGATSFVAKQSRPKKTAPKVAG